MSKITVTKEIDSITFDIKQGNQSRWFSLDEEAALELYKQLGSFLEDEPEALRVVDTFYGGYNILD